MESTAPVFGYTVEIDHQLIDSEDSTEEFGSWSETYNNTFRKIFREESHPDIVSVLDIKNGEPCFVLWASYSTGDSFGCAEDQGIDSIAVFTGLNAAQELSDFLHKAEDNKLRTGQYDTSIPLKFTTSDGQKHVLRPSWVYDHCETLSSLTIEKTVMCSAKNSHTLSRKR
jgi:hypothetical protein